MVKNKYVLTLLSLAVVSFPSLAATESEGGILNFSGAISDTTCTINGGDTTTLTIVLNPITVTDAGTAANTVITKNQKAFDLTFSDCAPASVPVSNLKIYFSSANISNSGLYLTNTSVDESDSSVARNVGFSLSTTGARTTPIPLNSALDTGFVGGGATTETLSLVASYFKTTAAAARAGAIESNVVYTVSYL
jgi:major type 1 subunit fimbrin (pilin)